MPVGRSYSRWFVAATIIAVLAVVALSFYIFGWVSGEEFSPDDFSRRSFAYNKMPIFGISVRGIKYDDSTPVFEQTLLADGFIGTPAPIKSWHLISDNKSDTRSSDFDARLLCRFLDLQGENNESIWIAWNEAHPELAVEFWPIIATLAQRYQYLDVSRIMLNAIDISKNDVEMFRKFMLTTACDSLFDAAKSSQSEGRFADAIELYSHSIEILPTHKALAGRAECFGKLGNDQKRDLDLQSANNFDTK